MITVHKDKLNALTHAPYGDQRKASMLQHLCQSLFQYEPDCPGYPTERYTVDVDGVQVADLTADKVQSRITDFSNGLTTLSLPLTQRLSESAVTVNMTKFNTVPTNRTDDMGNVHMCVYIRICMHMYIWAQLPSVNE